MGTREGPFPPLRGTCKRHDCGPRRLGGSRGADAMNGAPNIGFIDLFTDTFSKYIDSGFGLLKGEVGYLASTLIVIDMTIAGLVWSLAPDEDVLARLARPKVLARSGVG